VNELSSLATLTLHQLRQIAKEVGVTLHSHESRQELLDSIASTPDLPDLGPIITAALALEAPLDDASRPEPETRVVFLPRDPQWAYVFWEIADSDRQLALEAGASQLALRVQKSGGWLDFPRLLRRRPRPLPAPQ